jgi:tRNA pseudouridine55 synthase
MNGIINVLKPPGMTSNNVVIYIRKLISERKVGHTGTLDPQAAGVLPICVGKATKISNYLMAEKKVYRCEMTLGTQTDTLDSEGRIVNNTTNIPGFDQIEKTFNKYIGSINQVPPMYSAIKYKGRKLYELAREGIDVSLPARAIMIYSNKIIKYDPPNKVLFEIECSKGTYIRAICRDIGQELGCGAFMSFLLRCQVGDFSLENAYTLDDIKKLYLSGNADSFLIPIDAVLRNMIKISVPDSLYSRLINGNAVILYELPVAEEQIADLEYCRVYCCGKFIGVGSLKRDQMNWILRMRNVLI